jgi:hypothetical protein
MQQTHSSFHHLVTGATLFATGRLAFQPSDARAFATDAPLEPPARRASLIDRLGDWLWTRELARRDRYLSGATDIVDLENRMRRWENDSANLLY